MKGDEKGMNIYTSYFANFRRFPSDIVQISISRIPPKGYMGFEYKRLAPSYELLQHWKRNHDEDFYIQRFNSETLGSLSAQNVYNELERLSGGKDCVLLCYEKPEDFCHRHLVAEWLSSELGLKIEELKNK